MKPLLSFLVLVVIGCDDSNLVKPDNPLPLDRGATLDTAPTPAPDRGAPDGPAPDALAPPDAAPDAAPPAPDASPDTYTDTSVSPKPCTSAGDCDDGMACTQNACLGGACVTSPKFDCPWPAEQALQATNLTHIEGPLLNDFHIDLSGAVWDAQHQMLWVCRNTSSDSRVWAIEPDGKGSFQIAYKNGQRGEWAGFGDLEGLTLASLAEPETLYLMVEGVNSVKEYDLSTYGKAALKNSWNTGKHMPPAGGAEGITFVPDAFLKAQGFVDSAGKPRTSKRGMGGLMLVGHQQGGAVYAFDLDRSSGGLDFVGEYKTAATETAGLEFDRSTGQLLIWHGASFNSLEVARLSSTLQGGARKLDTEKVYTGPAKVPFGTDNNEGIAVMSAASCSGGQRGFFLTTDGGGFWSLLWYRKFPCN